MKSEEALNLARKAYPNDENLRVAYMLGLNEGYELHKQQMMKDAINGVIREDVTGKHIVRSDEEPKTYYKYGTKVKLIIVKED